MRKPAPKQRHQRSIVPSRPPRIYLKAWRKHFGLTLQELADRLPPQPDKDGPVLKGTISKWENEPGRLTLNVIAAYAEALGVEPIDLQRLPSQRPSMDARIEKASPALQDKIVEIVSTLLKP